MGRARHGHCRKCRGVGFRLEKTFYAGDQFLRLERFANQFIGADGNSFVGDAFIDYARH